MDNKNLAVKDYLTVKNSEQNCTLKQKKLHLEQQLLRLRAAYLRNSDENPNAIIEEIFRDTYCLGEGTPENPAFKICWDSPLAHIVSYSTAKLIRIHQGDKHVDDVLNSLFMCFSNRDRFLKIKEEYMIAALYQFITYNGAKGGTPEINEIFQIEARSVRKTSDQIQQEMERKGLSDETKIEKTYIQYFRLQSTDELSQVSEADAKYEISDPILDPINEMIENETIGDLIDLCNEIHYAVKRWIKKNGHDYDSFVEDVLSNEKKLKATTEAVFTRMGSHWTRRSAPLRHEIEHLINQYADLSKNKELLSCMSRFLTARKLIMMSIVVHYRGSGCL